MKEIILLLLLIGIILMTSSCDQIIMVEIVIPRQLIPYYEWLLCFPGLQPFPKDLEPKNIHIGMGTDLQ